MASITYDGQSFLIDGRRVWLAGGTIDSARCPRDHWADRIAAAKGAGLNAVTTTVVWARHEARPGQFDFTGENDLKHFVSLVGQAGMHCVLRLGPYVGGGFDFGGLPPWLLNQKDIALRTANTAFLEASSRYIGAVARQVRDLQASSPAAGPIIMVQSESAWTCGHDTLAQAYLGELNRYIRESGFDVPIINANDLWQGVEGEIDTWTGNGHLLANLRQLAFVRPMQPRIVSQYTLGRHGVWGVEETPTDAPDPEALGRNLAEVLAAAGQFNLEPFFGGTNFAFSAGRLPHAPDAFATTSSERHAPLDEAGKPGPLLPAVRRVAMFASRFARILSHLESRRPPVSILPESIANVPTDPRARAAMATGPSVIHLSGSQGSVAFLFAPPRDRRAKSKDEQPVPLLLADGSVLPVYMGTQPAAWCLFDVRLAGRSNLDYCNLSAFALVGKVFVVAGPAGSPARLSINGSPLDADVPEEDRATVVEHEGITVVICADNRLSEVQIADDAVFIGASGIAPGGEPIIPDADAECLKISAEGVTQTLRYVAPPKFVRRPAAVPVKGAGKKKTPLPPPPPPVEEFRATVVVAPFSRTPPAPTLENWTFSPVGDYVTGASARFASIAGPADLGTLGAPYGYGWYRLVLKSAAARHVTLAWPAASDRVHLFMAGHDAGMLGLGPGASPHLSMNIAKGDQTLVALVENFGRFGGSSMLGEGKGLLGHAMAIEPLRVAKGAAVRGQPTDPLSFRAPLFHVHAGDATDPVPVAWDLPPKRRGPVLVRFAPHTHRGLVLLNDTPLAFFEPAGPTDLLISPEQMSRGANHLHLAILGDGEQAAKDLAGALTFFDCEEEVTVGAEWSFAKWEKPTADSFSPLEKRPANRGHAPAWFRASFTGADRLRGFALELDCSTLSKGQVYLNGRHVGRYFANTVSGRKVGPTMKMLLPIPFLSTGKPNDLLIFDEHGASPAQGTARLPRMTYGRIICSICN